MMTSLLALLLSFCISGSDAYASNAQDVEVESVENIITAIPKASEYSSDFETPYSFTLESHAIVKVTVSQTHFKYGFLDTVRAIISADELGGSSVVNGITKELNHSEPNVQTVVLEAGTYYVKFTHKSRSKPEVNGKTTVGVAAQYITRTVDDNFSLKNAEKIKIGEEVTGFFTHSVNKVFYKFDINTKSKVKISVIGDKIFEDGKKAMVGTLYDSDYVDIGKINISKDGSAELLTRTLPKGTYYFSLDDSKSLSFYGINTVKVTTSKVTAAAPKVTSYKAGAKSVSGTAEKGAEVYVVCNGDTFIGTVDSKGKYSVDTTKLVKVKNVKVYIINDGIKSKITTVKVK